MKRIIMTWTVAVMGITAMMAQSHEVSTTDKNGNKVVYEISDAPSTKGDTLSITTFDPQSVAKSDSINRVTQNEDYMMTKEELIDIINETGISEWGGPAASTAIGGMILGGFMFVFLPIVIIVAVLLYRYFNRKKKYELAQKIVESGQPLPDDLSKSLGMENEYYDDKGLYEKGVKNVGIGIAFSIFMYFLTDSIALACIGLFIVANGVSQLLAHNHQKDLYNRQNSTNNTEDSSFKD
ncbi:MAG: DUF6249 domain-containing protein [Bacteroidaceae bacterium]|nr:DUF6249 domain-containing protein [Bacteroidaceae bacterium]